MPARVMDQHAECRRSFDELINRKRIAEEARFLSELSGVLPPVIERPVRLVALLWRRLVQHARDVRGKRAEDDAAFFLWLFLDRRWILMNDVVLECDGEWIQIDHLLVGPPGIFLVETKSWRGVFEIHEDLWRKRRGRRWTVCEENPVLQQERHAKLFRRWLWKDPMLRPLTSKVVPVVLFSGARCVDLRKCRMNVYRLPWSLAVALRTDRLRAWSEPILPDDVERVAAAIGGKKTSPPIRWPTLVAKRVAAVGLAVWLTVAVVLLRANVRFGWLGRAVAVSWLRSFRDPSALLPVGFR